MFILEQGAIANSNVVYKNFVWVEFNCLLTDSILSVGRKRCLKGLSHEFEESFK